MEHEEHVLCSDGGQRVQKEGEDAKGDVLISGTRSGVICVWELAKPKCGLLWAIKGYDNWVLDIKCLKGFKYGEFGFFVTIGDGFKEPNTDNVF